MWCQIKLVTAPKPVWDSTVFAKQWNVQMFWQYLYQISIYPSISPTLFSLKLIENIKYRRKFTKRVSTNGRVNVYDTVFNFTRWSIHLCFLREVYGSWHTTLACKNENSFCHVNLELLLDQLVKTTEGHGIHLIIGLLVQIFWGAARWSWHEIMYLYRWNPMRCSIFSAVHRPCSWAIWARRCLLWLFTTLLSMAVLDWHERRWFVDTGHIALEMCEWKQNQFHSVEDWT